MNTCTLSGRLTWAPELRYQSNGKPELSLRLSVPNGERDGKQFYLPFDIVVYGKDCEPLAEVLEAGDLVEFTGQNAWPKAPRKPGGKWIPAAICFSVTKLAGSASAEHERTPEYGHEADAPTVPTEAPEPAPARKARKPSRTRASLLAWTPGIEN